MEFSCPGRLGMEFRTKFLFFVFPFSAYLIPFWIKIMSEWSLLIFWIFLLFSLEFSSSGWLGTEFGTKYFFFSFSAYLNRFWIEKMLECCFFIFWIFLVFFLELSRPGRVGPEFVTKTVFSHSRPISSQFLKK